MPQHQFTRRRALWLGLAALTGLGTSTVARTITTAQTALRNRPVASPDQLARQTQVTGEESLRQRAKAKGLIYGAAARRANLFTDPALAKAYQAECGILVPEWELKWSSGDARLRPTLQTFDFSRSDWMLRFAQSHDMQMRGHVLVWHLGLPDWFEEQVNRQNAEQVLVRHIQTVAGHYAGKLHSWDVVNEAIEPNNRRADGLRITSWLQLLGPDYLDLAFRAAAAADPQAKLTYNDYGLEYDRPDHEARRRAVLKLLEQLKAQGTPIHAFGLQAHLEGHETRFNPNKLRRFLADVASLGLEIYITELDVIDNRLPRHPTNRDRLIAQAYEDFLTVALDEPAVKLIVTWGLSDRYTWLSDFHPRSDRAAVRPLLLDANLNRKLAWHAVARAIDQAPSR